MELNTVDDPVRFQCEEWWCNLATRLQCRGTQIRREMQGLNETIADLRGGYVSTSTVDVAAPKSGH